MASWFSLGIGLGAQNEVIFGVIFLNMLNLANLCFDMICYGDFGASMCKSNDALGTLNTVFLGPARSRCCFCISGVGTLPKQRTSETIEEVNVAGKIPRKRKGGKSHLFALNLELS